MSPREVLSRMVAAIRPWPPKAARKQAIARERARADDSRREAERARRIARELEKMARDDALAAAIARQIARGQDGPG